MTRTTVQVIIQGTILCGMVKGYDPETGYATVEQRNKMSVGDVVGDLRAGEKDISARR